MTRDLVAIPQFVFFFVRTSGDDPPGFGFFFSVSFLPFESRRRNPSMKSSRVPFFVL